MSYILSDQFKQPRRVRVEGGAKRSLAAVGAFVAAWAVVVPGLPLAAAAWGWMTQRRCGSGVVTGGRALAWAAVAVGMCMTAAQVAGVATGWRSWDRAQHGLGEALAVRDARAQRLLGAFDPAVAAEIDPRLADGFGRMLDHRYGALVKVACDSPSAGVPLLGDGSVVGYELTFEKGRLKAQAELVPSDLRHGVDDWAKVRRVVLHDPIVGAIPFPPPADWRPARVAEASESAELHPGTAVADVPVLP